MDTLNNQYFLVLVANNNNYWIFSNTDAGHASGKTIKEAIHKFKQRSFNPRNEGTGTYRALDNSENPTKVNIYDKNTNEFLRTYAKVITSIDPYGDLIEFDL